MIPGRYNFPFYLMEVDLDMTAAHVPVEIEKEVERQFAMIAQGTAEIVPETELKDKLRKCLMENRPLRLKLGMDPTAPDIHLGHAVVLQKIRQMQEFGHQVHLVIGDFTGQVGDPTGKSETRTQLSREQVQENAKTYVTQVFKILDPKRTEIVYNSSWLSALTFADVVRLASYVTVARMLERDDFHKRYVENRPIHIHEFFYPLMQAYDSVALQTDIEFGGTDQKFNLLMGRTLQKEFQQDMQVVLMMPLLEGLDGVHKMSKSLGNYVGVNEDLHTMFGKLMSIPDELLPKYYLLLLTPAQTEYENWLQSLKNGTLHPRDAKMQVAAELVRRFHGDDAVQKALEHWQQVFQKRELPSDIPDVSVSESLIWVVKALTELGLAKSNGEARRLIEGGAVRWNGEKIDNVDAELNFSDGDILQVGKRQFVRIRLS